MNNENELSIEEMIKHFKIEQPDLEQIRKYGKIIVPRIELFMDKFYEWMRTLPEYKFFFQSEERVKYARAKQTDYWRDFFKAEMNDQYIQTRRKIGETHAIIGLSLTTYALGMNKCFCLLMDDLYEDELDDKMYSKTIAAMTKMLNFDLTVTVESYNHFNNKQIADKNKAIMEMSTPLIQIWENIIMVPIVGIIDSKRSNELMNGILTRISETQSKIIILDISGVAIVDTAVANHLIKISKATVLMGAKCIFSGLSPSIAETIVELGIDVSSIETTGTLRDALLMGYKDLGLKVIKEID